MVIANIQFVKCLTLFLGPTLMAIFVVDETDKTQWRNIFLLLSGMLFIANAFFVKYATGLLPSEFVSFINSYLFIDKPAAFTLITSKV